MWTTLMKYCCYVIEVLYAWPRTLHHHCRHVFLFLKECSCMNAGCVSEVWPLGVMYQRGHWLWTNTIICIWFPEHGGGQGQDSGAMVLVQKSILYTPSLNQHSAPRSVLLETVMRCCATDPLASSIRTQPKPEAPSRWRRDKQKHSNGPSQC